MDSTRSTGTPVGLIGIGLVGIALAERLLSAGHDVIGYDIDGERRRRLDELGGTSAGSVRTVAEASSIVFLSLFDSETVQRVVEGPDGILAATPRPTYLIDTTTGDPDATERLAARLAKRGIRYLDATISGSSRQVQEGTAVFLVGGDEETFEACRDLLGALARDVFHVGPAGSGAKAKLATNLLIGLNRLALAEGLLFAEALGLDLERFLTIARATPAYSAAIDSKGRKMIEGDYRPESRVRQHRKDVALILERARNAGIDLPLSRRHAQILDALIDAGDGDLDNAAVFRALRRRRRK